MSAVSGPDGRDIYRQLLFLLPPDMRREFGDDMVRLFGDRLREAGTSWRVRARVWGRGLADLVSQSLAARWEGRGDPDPRAAADRRGDPVDAPDRGRSRARGETDQNDRSAAGGEIGGRGRSSGARADAGMRAWSGDESPRGLVPPPRRPGGRGVAALFEGLLRDLGQAIRGLRKSPGFSVVAVLTLGLGIGANTAIFTVVDGVLLRPLPYHEPDRLVRLWPEENHNKAMVERMIGNAPALEAATGVSGWLFTLTGEGRPEQISGAFVSHDHFEVLGVQPALGRGFTPGEALPGNADAVILSHGLWTRIFGGDPDILGRRIRLAAGDYQTRRVVGVMPAGYRPLEPYYRVWAPLDLEPGTSVRDDDSWYVNVLVGRLADGATAEQAAEQVRRIGAALHDEWPERFEEDATRASVVPLLTDEVGDFRQILWTLLGAVGVILLIACANVANLQLARATGRRRDLSLRAALGASRARLVGGQLVESLVLGFAGGVAGLLLAWASVGLLVARAPEEVPRLAEVGVDGSVLGFTLAVSLLATLVFGLVPAWRATSRDPHESLGGSPRGPVGVGRGGVNDALVAAEVALALVLVVGAGLMARSLWRLYHEEVGLDPGGVLTLRLSIAEGSSEDGALHAFYRQVRERVESIPGVTGVGAIQLLPLTDSNWSFRYFAEDNPVPEGSPPPSANFRTVTPGYFRTLGIPLIRGRPFGPEDTLDGPPVGIVNETLARRLWPDEDPLGKEIRIFSRDGAAFTVVGVVGDVAQHGVRIGAQPEMYRPYEQFTVAGMFLVVRSLARPADLVPSVRQAVWSLDPDVPIAQVRTMEEVFGESVAEDRFLTGLVGAFGGLAMVLGLMGVYGVMAYVVSRRLPEFGVRLALGAARRTVVRQALVRGLRPVAIGIVFGLIGVWWTSRLIDSMLYGVGANDPATFVVVPLALLTTAAGACALPAWRAGSADPLAVLREE